MSHQSELIGSDIHAYLAQHEKKELLRLLTCGSVDDGKSTLIGRLLHDSKLIYEDQLSAVRRDSVKSGAAGGDIDLALLVDGLQAEREQGITIDVAYRYFSTAQRKFIIADTPGHEQYTRNMATGASTCDLAIILIDARHGVQVQTRRHSYIVSLLGIKHVLVAVNKMDLMDYAQAVFDRIRADYLAFADQLELHDVRFIPLSALHGDNVVHKSAAMPWYGGPSLIELLNTLEIAQDRNFDDPRFPVQYVNRPHLDFRGYSGAVAAGVFRIGDPVMVLPAKTLSRIESIVTYDGELQEAFPPQAVTLTLADQIDVSRGDLLVRPDRLPYLDSRCEAHIVWMTEAPLIPGRQYLLKHATRTLTGSVAAIRHRIDVNTLERHPAGQLQLNEIGLCELALSAPLAFDPYRRCKGTGAFIVIDRLSNVTVGAGMILGPVQGEAAFRKVTAEERAARFGQKAVTVWLTGAGRQEMAYRLERRLFERGYVCAVIEADRLGAQTALVAESFVQAGIVCLCVSDTAPAADDLNHVVTDSRLNLEDLLALLNPAPTAAPDFVI
jgi:bifunctional enzyme CysN/CysC